MICPACGSENALDANYCSRCGHGLAEAAGSAPAAPVPTGAAGPRYAGFWRRFAALLVDGVALSIVNGVAANLLLGGPSLPEDLTTDSPQLVIPLLGFWAQAMGINTLIGWLYFAGFESSSAQATPGKMALGMRVITLDGGRLSFPRATGRYFAKFLSSALLLIGYLMAAFTSKKQALHDILAGTLVVRTEG